MKKRPSRKEDSTDSEDYLIAMHRLATCKKTYSLAEVIRRLERGKSGPSGPRPSARKKGP